MGIITLKRTNEFSTKSPGMIRLKFKLASMIRFGPKDSSYPIYVAQEMTYVNGIITAHSTMKTCDSDGVCSICHDLKIKTCSAFIEQGQTFAEKHACMR